MRTKIKFVRQLLAWLTNIMFHEVRQIVSQQLLATGRRLCYVSTSFKEWIILTSKLSSEDIFSTRQKVFCCFCGARMRHWSLRFYSQIRCF